MIRLLGSRKRRERSEQDHLQAETERLRIAAFTSDERATALSLVKGIESQVAALEEVLASGAEDRQTTTPGV